MNKFNLGVERLEAKANPLTPTRAIKHHMGNVHVGTSDAMVEQDIRNAISQTKDGRWTNEIMAECIEYAIACHRENQALYNEVMSGR